MPKNVEMYRECHPVDTNFCLLRVEYIYIFGIQGDKEVI